MKQVQIAALAVNSALLGFVLGCGSGTKSTNTTIPPSATAPTAAFLVAPAAGIVNQTLTFTDNSSGSPSAWAWTFGDGATSTLQNPTHAYSAAGQYTATLKASNSAGSNSASKPITVSAATTAPTAQFRYAPAIPVAGGTVLFSDTSTGGPAGWAWNFGDGATSAVQDPNHTYASTGANTVALTASNGAGSSTVTQLVTVLPAATGNNFNGTILLGSPEETSIKVNILSPDQSGTVTMQYGTSSGVYPQQTSAYALTAGTPLTVAISSLNANTLYYYRLSYRSPSGVAGTSPEYRFHTARPSGSTYTFTVQADSHLDGNSNLNTYLLTLDNVRTELPDFHIDLGDTFMCEKYDEPLSATAPTSPNEPTVDARYVYERNNIGNLSATVPVYLANGNHEGESGWMNSGAENVAIWATRARQKYYLNPPPDSFYSGDPTVDPAVGHRASSYAWQWGDAQFIVLDPYWYTATQPGNNSWAMTLGKAQYDWLEQTLASSSATFKFVLLHNLVGGSQGQMRGGVEAAPYFEWGGENADGSSGFSQNRADWTMPIHQLLVKYKVSAVFHGHDHLYARQTLDGIVYQEVPQPSASNTQSGPSLAATYGYLSGTILSSAGHIRITVASKLVTVEYVRTWLPSQVTATQKNGEVDDSYTIAAP